MTTILVPTAFHPSLTDGVQRRPSMQGQDVMPIVDRDTAPGCPLCQLAILMDPGKVSTPHIHNDVFVYVYLAIAGPQGVLTLYGDNLEHHVWLFQGGTLVIPPGIPHVAVYPRRRKDEELEEPSPVVVAIETRTTDHWTDDVVAIPELWATLYDKITPWAIEELIDFPYEMLSIHPA